MTRFIYATALALLFGTWLFAAVVYFKAYRTGSTYIVFTR